MYKLLIAIFLAIISHAPSSLHAHALAKRQLSLRTDALETISDLPISRLSSWLEENDEIERDLQDYIKKASPSAYQGSRLLSSLIGSFEDFGKLRHPETQSSRKSQSGNSHEKVEQHHEEEDDEEEGEDDEYDEEDRNHYEEQHEEKDRENDQEVYRKQQEEKYQKSEVHLFSAQGPPLRETLEEFKSRDLQKRKQIQTGQDPRISRIWKPVRTHFSYIHPEEWALDTPECSGRLQSPVNLDSDKLVGLDLPASLIWNGYWNQPRNMSIMDNGHSVELSGTWDAKTAPTISGGPLVGEYVFAQLHFHWGPKDSVGSEHTIDNKSFPMEMHMVHYKKDYQTLNEALKYDDGLAVVAFLMEISDHFNLGINLLEDSLRKIQNKPRIGIPVKAFPLAFLHFMFQEDYASYIGSLTTPPCREIVTWLVSASPLSISRRQLEFFRKISNKWPDKENYRPRQALNGRNLYYVNVAH